MTTHKELYINYVVYILVVKLLGETAVNTPWLVGVISLILVFSIEIVLINLINHSVLCVAFGKRRGEKC